MSFPQAVPMPRYMAEEASASITVSKPNPNIFYILYLVKGETRPPEEEIPELMRKQERGEYVFVQQEEQGLYESRGAAERAERHLRRLSGGHDRDKYQIRPILLNAIPSRERFHLPDDADSPPETEYEVINKAELKPILQRLEALSNGDG
jgi:hypothetical protein